MKDKFKHAGIMKRALLDRIVPRYYIYVFNQIGNVGAKQCFAIEDQPKDGFDTKQEAITYLKQLKRLKSPKIWG